jgi:ubiquinone/menaquinone biosynthesis C-methylase UbiE
MLTSLEYEIAPCLEKGPLSQVGSELVEAARDLGWSRRASILRAWCVAHVFERQERIFAENVPPTRAIVAELDGAVRFLRASLDCGFVRVADQLGSTVQSQEETATVEEATGSHYGHLFQAFSDDSYWKEAAYLLRLRLDRNGIEPDSLPGKSVLDVGCGGGRYTAAWRTLGGRPVLGVDVSPLNIATAHRRTSSLDDIDFRVGDVLDLSLEDDSYDIVFSNGVLHHTKDWRKGITEVCRILKPGGFGWLYVIEKPGGLFWDLVEILRVVVNKEDRESARTALSTLGLAANRIFYMLDHVMAPINERLTSEEVEDCLRAAGAIRIRRLQRGVDFDRVERIYQGEPFAFEKYGIGENRFVFSKG